MSGKDFYILFPDVTSAQKLYGILKEEEVQCTLAPTPRDADKCCGVAILYYKEEDKEKIEDIINKNKVQILKFYEKENSNDPDRMKFC